MDSRQGIALVLVGILILNLVLLGMGKISELYFWLIVAAMAIATMFYKKRYKAGS